MVPKWPTSAAKKLLYADVGLFKNEEGGFCSLQAYAKTKYLLEINSLFHAWLVAQGQIINF